MSPARETRARAVRRRTAGPRDADADPLALHSPLRARAFFAVLERRLQKAFAAVRLAGDAEAGRRAVAGRPLVLYCNHPAWWDVAVVARVARLLAPERRIFAPFDAEALGRYRFLARCGAFPVDPASPRGARRLLDVGGRVLAEPDALLCITPQGAFRDPRERPVALQRGLAGLLARTPRAIAVPVALEYPFWTEARPEALARLGTPVGLDADAGDARDVGAWHDALVAGLAGAMDALAADAVARDPTRFRALHEGTAGVGGVYDAWRRLRAALAGRRFDARHAAVRPPERRVGGAREPSTDTGPC